MINRKKLITGLESAIGIQKRLILLLNRHISAAVTYSGLEAAEKEEILEKFQSMVLTHDKHSQTLASVLEEVKSEEDNVF